MSSFGNPTIEKLTKRRNEKTLDVTQSPVKNVIPDVLLKPIRQEGTSSKHEKQERKSYILSWGMMCFMREYNQLGMCA